MRTLEEIIDLLKGSLYFAVFDSTKSFFHVPIAEASRQLTAMLTLIGIYLYNVLAMGLSNATDIFESCMRNIVEGLEDVVNIADDVLVFATKYEKFKTNVISFLDRCVVHDLHLNPDKIHINIDSVPFFGQTLTKHGLMMDENKWKVVQEWPVTTCIKELQYFLGSVNYLSKFIPFLSAHRKPLQELLKQSENDFTWQDCRFSRFIIKKCASLTARCTIQLLLEIFMEHGIPSSVRCDRGRNFVSSEFGVFCIDLGIKMSYSSAYHHSSNQAEHAVRTVKDLIKQCHSAGVS